MVDKLVLRTALGAHDHVKPLRDGRVISSRVELAFQDFEPLPKAFRLMVRSDALDLSEMAVVTHVMAHHFGKPLTGLAIPLWSRLPHTNLVCPAQSALEAPQSLEGTSVGVRAYGQTSGVWVRGILESEYGVDLDTIRWMTMEDAHLSEYADPPIAARNTSSKGLRQLMLDGELSAIMGERDVSPDAIRTVIPDAEAAALRWIGSSGIMPINHGLVMQTGLHEAHPWLAQELMNLFAEARRIAVEEDGAAAPPEYGLAPNRASIDLLLAYSERQKITPRRYVPEDLFLEL